MRDILSLRPKRKRVQNVAYSTPLHQKRRNDKIHQNVQKSPLNPLFSMGDIFSLRPKGKIVQNVAYSTPLHQKHRNDKIRQNIQKSSLNP